MPGTLTDAVVELSPFWLDEAGLAKQHASRTTQLFFSGALCWKTSTIARSERQLKDKCDRSYSEAGFLSRYSFGLRYEIFRKHRSAPGFRLHASDFPPSLPSRGERLGGPRCSLEPSSKLPRARPLKLPRALADPFRSLWTVPQVSTRRSSAPSSACARPGPAGACVCTMCWC